MMGTGSARARPTPSSITGGSGATSREKQCSQGTGGLDTSPTTRGNALELLCPPPWHPAPQPASAAKGLSAQQGHRRHQSGCTSLGLAPPSCCAHGTEQTPAAKSPCSNPSPANPRPSSSKHPTLKEQHHHGHNRTPAASTQGKGQPQTPETSLPQPRGARNGAKLAPGPPASPTAIGNLGWALPPATRPQPRSRHKQGNKNPFGKSSPCSQRIISQLKGHKGI